MKYLLLINCCIILSFAEFKKITHPGLKADYIRAFARNENKIFIGTTEGLFFKRKDKDAITKVFNFPSIYIRDIYTAPDGILWIASYDGVYKLDIKNYKLLKWYTKTARKTPDGFNSTPGLSSDNISCIAGNESTVFVGTDRWGINTINVKTETIGQKRITSINGLPSDKIKDIYLSPAMIIVSTSKGIAYKGRWSTFWMSVDDEKSPAHKIPVQQTVYLNNKLFIGTLANGIMELSLDSPDSVNVFSSANNILPSDEIVGLAVDGQYLWISLFSGQVVNYSLKTLEWKIYDIPALGNNTLDKIFIDGQNVYVGSDGRGMFMHRKEIPEVSFFPEISFKQKQMHIIGAVVSENSIQPVQVQDIRYRDSDILSPFTSKGVKIHVNEEENIYHNVIASIDFSGSDHISKLWNYEVRFKVTDKQGRQNEASAIFLYDARKPQISLVKFANNSIQYTAVNKFKINGKVSDHKLKRIYYAKHGSKQLLQTDSRGNFQVTLKNLREGENNITFNAIDFCNNNSTKGVTIIYDSTKPDIENKQPEYIISSAEEPVKFKYIEDNLYKASLMPRGAKIGKDMEIDRTLNTISAVYNMDSSSKPMTLKLYDKANNTFTYDFLLKRDDNKPVIIFKDNYNEIETSSSEFKLYGKVRSKLSVSIQLYQSTNRIKVDQEAQNGLFIPFSAVLPVKKRLTLFTVKAVVQSSDQRYDGLTTEKNITIIGKQFEKLSARREKKQKQSSKKVNASEIAALKAEIARLRRQKKSKVKVIYKGNQGVSPFYANKPAIKLVSYKNMAVNKLAEKYTGDSKFGQLIDIINQKVTLHDIKQKNKIAVPNRAMAEFIIEQNNRSLTDLITLVSYLLFINKTGSIKQFRNEIAKRFNEALDLSIRDQQLYIKRSATSSKVKSSADRQFKGITIKLLKDSIISVTVI